MLIRQPIIEVIFLRRYKRFLADVRLPNGDVLTVHCPNSGSMKGCNIPGVRAWISDSENPKRKLRHTLEVMEVDGALVCVNTHRPNELAEDAIRAGSVAELVGYPNLRREVRYGHENSRIDLLLEDETRRCFVEVKNVSLGASDGRARFPDAVTTRGTKHLRELMSVVEGGDRAVLLFCASRTDTTSIAPADEIDPLYGQTLRQAVACGVEVIGYRLTIDLPSLWLSQPVAIDLTEPEP